MNKTKPCWLSLGSNLPFQDKQPIDVLKAAIAALGNAGVHSIEVSGFYQTEPVPKSDQPDFINCVVTGATDLLPHDLLAVCQSIEMSYGRKRATRWGTRTLDIDIIDYDQQLYPSVDEWHAVAVNVSAGTKMPELVLPHPFMHVRAFVLKPLCDLTPDWRHPVYRTTAVGMLLGQPQAGQAGIVPIGVK